MVMKIFNKIQIFNKIKMSKNILFFLLLLSISLVFLLDPFNLFKLREGAKRGGKKSSSSSKKTKVTPTSSRENRRMKRYLYEKQDNINKNKKEIAVDHVASSNATIVKKEHEEPGGPENLADIDGEFLTYKTGIPALGENTVYFGFNANGNTYTKICPAGTGAYGDRTCDHEKNYHLWGCNPNYPERACGANASCVDVTEPAAGHKKNVKIKKKCQCNEGYVLDSETKKCIEC